MRRKLATARICVVVATLAPLVACATSRPSVQVERMHPAPAVVWIADVAVLDVARGERTPGLDVRIEESRIAAIEPAGEALPPDGALVISGSGATLVPGLVDMHGHVYANPAPAWEPGLPDTEAVLRSYLYSGVTSLLDPGDSSSEAFERRARVASGELIGPRIFTAGPMHTAPDGHPIAMVRELAPRWIAWWIARHIAVPVGSEREAADAVDDVAAEGADVVKITIDALPLGAPRMSRDVARAMVERARAHGLRTVAHIGTTEDAIDAAEAGVAAWVHGVYKERIPDDQIAVLAGYGIPMVVTVEVFDSYARARHGPRVATALERETAPQELLGAFYPTPEDFDPGSLRSWLQQNEEAAPARLDNVRRLHAAGVTILAGSDAQSGVFPGPGLHRELANLVRAGLTPVQAIRAATLDAARFLAQSDDPDFGNVSVGQRADLLLVEGDPAADVGALERIREVLLAGVPLVRTPITGSQDAARAGRSH